MFDFGFPDIPPEEPAVHLIVRRQRDEYPIHILSGFARKASHKFRIFYRPHLLKSEALVMMRPFALSICCLVSCCVLAGCSKQREISGEIFTRDFEKGIVKQSGTVVHFLTAPQRERFEALVRDWRDRRYKDQRELWDKSYKEYRELV